MKKKVGTQIKIILPPFLLFLLVYNINYFFPIGKPSLYKIGEVIKEDIRAPFTFPLKKTPEELKKEEAVARKASPVVLVMDREAEKTIFQKIKNLEKKDLSNIPLSETTKNLLFSKQGEKIIEITKSTLKKILTFGYFPLKEQYSHKEKAAIISDGEKFTTDLRTIMGPSEVDSILRVCENKYFKKDYLKEAYRELTISLLDPNLSLDRESTLLEEERCREAISPIETIINKGEIIGKKGTKVDSTIFWKLKVLEDLRYGGKKYVTIIKENIFLLLLFSIFLSMVQLIKIPLHSQGFWFISILTSFIFFVSILLRNFISPYVIPFAAFGILLTMFLGSRVSFLLIPFLGLIFSNAFLDNLYYFFFLIAVGAGTSFGARDVFREMDFLKSGALATIAGVIAYVSTEIGYFMAPLEITKNILWIIIGAGLGVFISFLFVPLIERFTNLASEYTLARLMDLNRPILKEFALKAPGSYNHSLGVADLSEKAAKVTGANFRLARCGAYYHDIGKILKPNYFIENQLRGENPHESLNPKLSSLILSSHVKEGVRLAQKLRLPKCITDIIAQHHGTTKMGFFYEMVRKSKEVVEGEFKYQGPKPSTKEAGIVMLADAVEAATRAKGIRNEEDLKKLVNEVIRERVEEGELDESLLTLKDLAKIENVFVDNLLTIYHPRVDYEEFKSSDIFTKKDKREKKNRKISRKDIKKA